MPNLPRKLGRLFLLQWSDVLQYRLDLILWVLSDAVTPLVSMAVWYAVASSAALPLSPRDTLTYFVMVSVVVTFTSAWGGYFLSRDILTGDIVRFLIRPISIFWHIVINNLAEKTFKLLLPLLGLVVVFTFFPQIMSPAIYVPRHIILFALSLLLAAGIVFVLDLSIGALAFWLEDANSIRQFQYILQAVASGMIVPIAFLPHSLSQILNWLPFRYTISAPLELLLGQASGFNAIKLLGLQALWLAVMTAVLALLWRLGLKKYAAPGQ